MRMEQALERKFYMVSAVMVSAIGGFPEGQAQALRLRLPQLLWKVHTTRGVCMHLLSLFVLDEWRRKTDTYFVLPVVRGERVFFRGVVGPHFVRFPPAHAL